MVSPKAEDYIKTIWHLQGDNSDVVPPSEIAALLDVTAPTVTATLKTLQERGLVEREEYKGGRLTDKGEAVALEMVRHHRLLELFLAEHLDYDWAEVHEEADRLEHHISEKLETELAAVLGDPAIDPHGAPIPTADLDLPDADDIPLSDCREGDVVSVVQVADRDPDLLDYLADVGITPGSQLEVREIAPFNMIIVAVSDESVSLPEKVAALVRVREGEPTQSDNGTVVAG